MNREKNMLIKIECDTNREFDIKLNSTYRNQSKFFLLLLLCLPLNKLSQFVGQINSNANWKRLFIERKTMNFDSFLLLSDITSFFGHSICISFQLKDYDWTEKNSFEVKFNRDAMLFWAFFTSILFLSCALHFMFCFQLYTNLPPNFMTILAEFIFVQSVTRNLSLYLL